MLDLNALEDLVLFNKEIQKKIQPACQTLFRVMGINYFGHTRVFTDYSATALVTDPEMVRFWVVNQFPIPAMLKSGFYLASQMEELLSPSQCVELRANFCLDHVLFFVDRKEYYVDIYMIATQPDRKKILNNYINYNELLKNFFYFYQSITENEVIAAKDNRIYLTVLQPEHQKPVDLLDDILAERLFIQPVLETSHHQQAQLTDREWICMKFAAEGKTAKETARILNISWRTVETYIEHVKQKLKCSSKREAIKIFTDGLATHRHNDHID